MFSARHCRRLLVVVALTVAGVAGFGKPIDFDIPAQPASRALLAFSRQAGIDILFSFDDLNVVETHSLHGSLETADALAQLLRGTGFEAQQNGEGKFVVTPAAHPTGSLHGRLVDATGTPVAGARVLLPLARMSVTTGANGAFDFTRVPPGTYELIVTAAGFDPLRVPGIVVELDHTATLPPRTLVRSADPARLAPFIVEGESAKAGPIEHNEIPLGPRIAAGNLDLVRTEGGALPFTVYNRTQISRSGVINLNEFLQRELLDSSTSALPPEQNGTADSITAGSTNLALRGYEPDSTIVLVNGRRMPEILTAFSDRNQPPDVNFIPLSLVQQVEVLPVSASALYGGNAVGGVINIVLRPEADAQATEIASTYTNALAGYDASQSSLSLLHTESLLRGALRIRVNATFTQATPPIERELGFLQRKVRSVTPLDEAVYGATPNIHTFRPDVVPATPEGPASNPPAFTPPTDGLQPGQLNLGLAALPGLFGPGSSPVTSVAPGASGTGGLGAFAGREGVRNPGFFKPPGGFASAPNTIDYLYGRRQQRSVYYGSFVYDLTPWLQLGFDGTYATTKINRGYDVLNADLTLRASSPLNPFGQDIDVALNDTPRALGENYSTGRIEYGSAVGGLLLTLPRQWRVSLDGQYAHNLVKFRGLVGASITRWQSLVDRGIYNPLRDTQVYAPPAAFYDEVLLYRGVKDRFVTLGNYDTLDLAVRVTQEQLRLPTGNGVVNLGADYRRNHLADLTDTGRFADGSPAWENRITGRTLRRYSFFSELQAPLVPKSWLPAKIEHADTDLALRYLAADRAGERTLSPTAGLKVDFTNGLSLRGSVSASTRVPTPQLWRPYFVPGVGDGEVSSANQVVIFDPRRNQSYLVDNQEVVNTHLRAESALTQTFGVMWRRGKVHRVRVALDFVDTRKVNEIISLAPAEIVQLESLLPERVARAPLAPGDTHTVGRVTSVVTSTFNLAWRHSQNWNALLDYAWTECAGGTLELYGRFLAFTRFERQLLPGSSVVDELELPDTGNDAVLRYRSNFGAAWSNRQFGGGFDGHYYHSRVLPISDWDAQGHDRIRPYWQFDAFVQHDIARWLPWKAAGRTLQLQLRVNNLFAAPFPKFASDQIGVQPYGDWRGRVYSLSLTATF